MAALQDCRMAEGRRLKTLMNRTWFKSRRGGQSLTPRKDLPFHVQKVELETRKMKLRKEEEEGTSQTDRKVGGQGQATPPPNKEEKVTQIKQIETVMFVPATPGSELKTRLPRQDNILCQASNCPQVRFVERAGTTLMEELGKNNPWA